ncbi:MAG: NAD(P)H-quinone oxidoreductase [Rhodospirillales bacterium]|jgi:putative PIG3 family NAD(P)H quinone oxidoreductase|nr:NAD(P)H-quinone oxidoreductase [Rhodospirillales bacterium]HJO73253.1 NAD(P)H-quinone oxidoreductase [Rhodospirillales bacterium]
MTDALPDTMTCIEISESGGPEVLKPGSRPLPVAGAGEVLVRVAAAGVNRPDIMQRRGMYSPPPGVSDIPGLEIAGTVAALGPEVSKWKVGDTLCGLVAGGGYAEYCAAPAPQCLPFPKGLDAVAAAALPETFFTVWTNVFGRARLQPGETLLVHGGSSGIGTAAIQMASRLGARVMATAGSAEKCAACEDLGAERAINYRDEDFVEAAKAFSDGHGVDVILDMVGGDYVVRNIAALARGGRIASIAFLQGSKVEVDLMPLLMKHLTITASTLRPQTIEQKGEIASALLERFWPLIEAGDIKPVIDSTFPLADAAEAHRLMESSRHIGKIMLVA